MITDLELFSLASVYNGPMNYTFACENSGHYSWLDNIYIKFKRGLLDILNVDGFNNANNFSDHCAMC